ncbi:hypothetical protein A0U91_00275 [Acetobacter persici]|uniref:Uncharacterized protein n=1 Tax=Acetobacter persici TaxID=1076596 RepID=A0A1U9LBJ6_9PROT|nr:hypothetical protein A0U91_00275 [Acetobacter persici]
MLSIDNYTTGVTASNTGNFAQVYTPTQTINLGDSGDSAAASTYDLATFLVWSDILSADDQAAAVSWLRQYAASYGVSA